jgi:hypothetical protein
MNGRNHRISGHKRYRGFCTEGPNCHYRRNVTVALAVVAGD